MVPGLVLDCTMTGFYDFMLAKNSKLAIKLVTASKQVGLSNLLVRPQPCPKLSSNEFVNISLRRYHRVEPEWATPSRANLFLSLLD
jgi:hypothetical protein